MGSGSSPLACALTLVSCLLACGVETGSQDCIARLDGSPVTWEEFASFVESTVGEGPASLEESALSGLFQQFLSELRLVRLARERGWVGEGDARQEVLEKIWERAVSSEVSAAEIERYFDSHQPEFHRPERLVVGQILIQEHQVALAMAERLQAGEDFAAVAARMAELPGVVFAGYVGELSRRDLDPAFRDELFSLEPGEVSPILEADYGYHLFHLKERLPEGALSFEEAAPEIEEELRRRRADLILTRLQQEARARFATEVCTANLPFVLTSSEEHDDPYEATD